MKQPGRQDNDRRHQQTQDLQASHAVLADDQVFLPGCTGLSLDGGEFVGAGDPAAQAEAAMENVCTLVEAAGGRLQDICLINNFTTRHADRALVYPVIARHLQGVNPVSTGLVVEALADPRMDFAIDAWVVIPRDREAGHARFRLTNARGGFLMPNIDYGNARVIRANDHLFLQGQTGMSLDGRDFDGAGDPARQVEVAMENVHILLADAGSSAKDICKITTYFTDPTHRAQIDAVLARHLGDVQPTVTSVVVKDLARPELDFEIDVHAILRDDTEDHVRRPAVQDTFDRPDSGEARWPQSRSVRAGNFLFLQGQSGIPLDGSEFIGADDPAAQAEQAMQNVRQLLAEAGAGMQDICKVTIYTTTTEAQAALRPVLEEHLRGTGLVSTQIVVTSLPRSEMSVVFDVFAVISQERPA